MSDPNQKFISSITNYNICFFWIEYKLQHWICMMSEKPLVFPYPYIYCLTFYILVWRIKKTFSFSLSHYYCACSKEKLQKSWQHFHIDLILSYSESSVLLFYFDLWWFETLVCYDNVVRFYCDHGRIMSKNIKTIHFSIISLIIIFLKNFVISIKWVKLESINIENLNFIISIIGDFF